MVEVAEEKPSLLKDVNSDRCLYCSELANGLTESGTQTCGDPICGIIVKSLPAETVE